MDETRESNDERRGERGGERNSLNENQFLTFISELDPTIEETKVVA